MDRVLIEKHCLSINFSGNRLNQWCSNYALRHTYPKNDKTYVIFKIFGWKRSFGVSRDKSSITTGLDRVKKIHKFKNFPRDALCTFTQNYSIFLYFTHNFTSKNFYFLPFYFTYLFPFFTFLILYLIFYIACGFTT